MTPETEKRLIAALEALNRHLSIRTKMQSFWRIFLNGIVSGFGSVIGATIVVALLIFVLSKLNFLPFVNVILRSLTRK